MEGGLSGPRDGEKGVGAGQEGQFGSGAENMGTLGFISEMKLRRG